MNPSLRFHSILVATLVAGFTGGCDSTAPPAKTAQSREATKAATQTPAVKAVETAPAAETGRTKAVAEIPPRSAALAVAVPLDIQKKLDPHLLAAMAKGSAAQAGAENPAFDPDIPVQDGDRVLVDIKAAASKGLLDRIPALGGTVVGKPGSTDAVRAMVPFAQLPALAALDDVQSIAPAALTATREAGS